MRFAVTVRVDVDQVRDLLVDVEPDATMSDLAGALGEAFGRAPDGLWVGGHRLDDGGHARAGRPR